MQKIGVICSLVVMGLCLTTVPAYANTVVRSGESVDLKADQHVDGNFYILAGATSLSGDVNGDVTAAAGTITINGPVTHDVLLLSTNVGLYATVTEDVRIVAGTVTIGDEVKGSVFVMGGQLKILSTAKIDGDVFFVGGSVQSDGSIGGKLLGTADDMRVDGPVDGGIDVAVTTLTLGDHAHVKNGIRLQSINEIDRALGAVVEGDTSRTTPKETAYAGVSYKTFALLFVVSLFASLCLYLVARRFVVRLVEYILHTAGHAAVVGFGAVPALLLATAVLFATGLGVFLGVMVLTFLVGLMLVTLPLLNIIAGTLAAKIVTDKMVVNSFTIAGGALLLQLLLLVPIVGPMVYLGLFLVTFGGIVSSIHKAAKII
jgi:hypothetical protein